MRPPQDMCWAPIGPTPSAGLQNTTHCAPADAITPFASQHWLLSCPSAAHWRNGSRWLILQRPDMTSVLSTFGSISYLQMSIQAPKLWSSQHLCSRLFASSNPTQYGSSHGAPFVHFGVVVGTCVVDNTSGKLMWKLVQIYSWIQSLLYNKYSITLINFSKYTNFLSRLDFTLAVFILLCITQFYSLQLLSVYKLFKFSCSAQVLWRFVQCK